jgi:hypothetical protein
MRLSLPCLGLFAAALLSLASPGAPAADRPPIKTVGIVADVGDKVALQHIGFMVFSNARNVQDVPDWASDAHIAAALSEGLKGRYELRPVDYPRGEIAPELGRFLDDPDPEDNMRAKARPKDGEPIDAYLVVWPSRSEIYPTNQMVEGIGLLTQGSTARFYISLRVSLLDGATFKEIDTCMARVRDVSFWNPDKHFMNDAPDGYDDIETFDAMTPEQKQTMQTSLKQMLTDGMNYCLRDLKLVE